MSKNTQNILKKINYIEADMEIQKQILFSIPSDNKDEMEKSLNIIAKKKEQIHELREKIKKINPEEFDRITRFEEAAMQFKQLAAEKNFKEIVALSESQECSITLKDGSKISCLVKARDESGEWTVLTFDGDIRHYSKDD